MTTFQFDKCFNSKKVVKACNDDGVVSARRLDKSLYDAEDPEILAAYMPGQNPVITIDLALPAEHCDCIPDRNPGIVVVAYSRYIDRTKETLKTITAEAAAKILKRFKADFPEWYKVSIRDCIIELTDKYIEIFCAENGVLKSQLRLVFATEANWSFLLLQFFQGKAVPEVLPAQPPVPDDPRV